MSVTRTLYQLARLSNNLGAIASSDPERANRRLKNIMVGRALGRAGAWRWLWK